VARRRASRITAPRVSRNPGLYAAVVPVPADPGPYRSYIFSVVGVLDRPVVLGSRRNDVRARRMQGPRQAHRETGFSRLRRGQAVRAHATHILCRYLRENSPRLASFLPICPNSLEPHCFNAICVICHVGILTDRSIPHEWPRASPFACRSFGMIR